MKKIVFHFLQKVYYAKHWTSITKVSKSDLRKNIDSIKLSTIEKPTFKWVASREKNTSDCPRDSQVEDYPDSCPKRTHSITILTSITKSFLSSLGLSSIQSAICRCMSGISFWPIKVKTTVRERCFFSLCFPRAWEKENFPWVTEPQTFRFHAPTLYHSTKETLWWATPFFICLPFAKGRRDIFPFPVTEFRIHQVSKPIE